MTHGYWPNMAPGIVIQAAASELISANHKSQIRNKTILG